MPDANTDTRSFIDALDEPLLEDDPRELLVDPKTGRVRQAGATDAEGRAVERVRARCEASLYVFAKAILHFDRLTPALHGAGAAWLTRIPPRRKLLLWPRGHYKTSLVSLSLPLHMLIQPEDSLYLRDDFPGASGSDTRILLAGETELMAKKNLRWIAGQFETNPLLRAFWPHRCWPEPRRQAPKWNELEIIVPRERDFPDVSIRAIGVGGAVTGSHFHVLLKDDLISIEAANSPTVMQTAIEWHTASRALGINPETVREISIGTRWAVADLYSHIMQTDPTVEVVTRAIVENGRPILPESYSLDAVDQLQKEFGILFPLLYMNAAGDPSLVDFDAEALRTFAWDGDRLVVAEDQRDALLAERLHAPAPVSPDAQRGMPLTPAVFDLLLGRHEYLRLKAR